MRAPSPRDDRISFGLLHAGFHEPAYLITSDERLSPRITSTVGSSAAGGAEVVTGAGVIAFAEDPGRGGVSGFASPMSVAVLMPGVSGAVVSSGLRSAS